MARIRDGGAFAEQKISVIIPVYNSAPYLKKGLDSVMNQTYRNLEIILVDDGSTDGSGAICDRYAERDVRAKVIHQENAGVAAARNAGLDAAAGDYIGWVDSDDWIEPQMFERMLDSAEAYRADIVICGRQEIYPERCFLSGWQQLDVLNKEQAIALLGEDDLVKSYLWDKLWRRELFEDIRIPELRVFEDMAVMYQLFMRAEQVVCLPEVLYHYRQREGSIVDNTSLGNRINHYIASKERYDALSGEWPQFRQLMEAQCVASAVGIWAGCLSNPRGDREKYVKDLQAVADFSAIHYQKALKYMDLGLAGRMVLRLTQHNSWWAFAAARGVAALYRWKHGREL